MNHQFALRGLRLATLAAAAALAGCSMALLPPDQTPLVPASTSVEQATRKLEQVAAARARIEAAYAASEQVCYHKFFVTNCLDAAKEKRHSALVYQGAVEDEAQYYKRKANVDERDREVAKAVKEFEEDEARAAARPAAPPRPEVKTIPVAPKGTLASRSAKRDTKVAQHAAREQAEASKRAASAKAFEQRKLDAEKRQRDVAERLARKAAKAAAK